MLTIATGRQGDRATGDGELTNGATVDGALTGSLWVPRWLELRRGVRGAPDLQSFQLFVGNIFSKTQIPNSLLTSTPVTGGCNPLL